MSSPRNRVPRTLTARTTRALKRIPFFLAPWYHEGTMSVPRGLDSFPVTTSILGYKRAGNSESGVYGWNELGNNDGGSPLPCSPCTSLYAMFPLNVSAPDSRLFQPSTKAFPSHSLDLARNFMTSPNGGRHANRLRTLRSPVRRRERLGTMLRYFVLCIFFCCKNCAMLRNFSQFAAPWVSRGGIITAVHGGSNF